MSSSSNSPLHHSFINNRQPRSNGLPYSSTLTPNHRPSRSLQTNITNNNSTTPSRSLITVLPPASLPSNPPQVRSSTLCSGYGPPSGFSRGILIPLYPTLAAQMAAIAREYGLPSTGGMMVYMIEASPQLGELAKHMVGGPKISEAAWNILWSGIFEEEEAEAFERELLQRDQLYSEPASRQYYNNNPEADLNEDHEEIQEEEALNSSLEDIVGSAIDFPIPPAHHRPSLTPSTQDHHHHPHNNHPAQTSSISSSDDPKLNHTHTTSTIHRRIPSRQRTDDRFKLADRLIHHAHSHSSIISNKINPTRVSSSADLTSRPTSPTSVRPPFRSSRPINSIRLAHHPAPISDRGSSYSASSLRPRRIGAGMIVGKIEFDIDCSRSNGRWYQQWLNPSKLARNDYSSSTTPVSADSSRPLLLPNLITQRSQSSTSPNLPLEKESPTSHFNNSLRSTDLSSSSSRNQSDNSHSFLAFDDPAPLSGSDLGRSQLTLDKSTDTPDRSMDYRNSSKLTSEKYPLDSGRIFYSNEPRGEKSSPPGEGSESKRVGGRIVSDKHRQAISLIEAQAKHQSLVEQIDAQLSSPIKLEPVPQHHSYGFGNLTSTTTTTTLPGLSLEVSNRPDLADSRYKRNEQGSHSSCTSSPDTDPANMTHSSTGSTSSNSSVDVPDNQELLLPGLWASKRSSSMAIEANLKELEQALVSLSPRALRSGPNPLPSPISLDSSSSNPRPIATQPSNNLLAGSSICSPEYLIHAGPNKNRLNSSSTSSALLQSSNQDQRGGMSKFFDSLQESYQDIKARSSLLPPQPQHSSSSSSASSSTPSGSSALSGSEVPVGNTSGYTREDVRETQAPTSPLPTITSFSSNPTPILTPDPTPTTTTTATTTTATSSRRNNSFKLPPRTTSFFRKNSSSSSAASSTIALTPLSSSISSTSHPNPDGFVSKAATLVVGKFRNHSGHFAGFASPAAVASPKRKITLENLAAS
ncbi:hypothetical protein PGT21_035024 [Puccinia graminis f. sp. tritici]|uniref:Uncharacterized protein n=2 Tax=Puccinia graminis f. sp. tritici TaxID=56615 RepID=A0A5B0QQY4_PUCGR|nr:hypothetical protein PGT21_035024 [Puccinia graminis f. sp. tritici]